MSRYKEFSSDNFKPRNLTLKISKSQDLTYNCVIYQVER